MENKFNIIIVFVGVVLGIAFLSILAQLAVNNTTLISGSEIESDINFTVGEHILDIITTYSNAECNNMDIINATGGEEVLITGNYTFNSENCTYVVEPSSSYLNENVNSSYTYTSEPNSYLSSSVARTFVRLLVGLFALLILLFLLNYVIKSFGDKE